MKLSIIIPAHNEEKRISRTLEDYGQKFKKNTEIIVVLNECKDKTLSIVKKLKKKYPQIKYLDFQQSGKGFAIIEGFKAAKGELIGFVDADDATTSEAFDDLVKKIDGFNGVIASRYLKGAVVSPKQPITRIIASRVFNFLIRALFGLNFKDTQCGAKLFKKEAIKPILPKLGLTDWAFDIDLLYQMKKSNLRIKEIPTEWRDIAGSKINIRKTSIRMLVAIIKLRLVNSPFRRTLKMIKPLIKKVYSSLK